MVRGDSFLTDCPVPVLLDLSSETQQHTMCQSLYMKVCNKLQIKCSRGFSAVTGFLLLLRYFGVMFIRVSLGRAKWPHLFVVTVVYLWLNVSK